MTCAKHEYVHHSALTDLLGSLIAGRFDQQSLREAVNLVGGALHGDSWGKKGKKIKKPSVSYMGAKCKRRTCISALLQVCAEDIFSLRRVLALSCSDPSPS